MAGFGLAPVKIEGEIIVDDGTRIATRKELLQIIDDKSDEIRRFKSSVFYKLYKLFNKDK